MKACLLILNLLLTPVMAALEKKKKSAENKEISATFQKL